MQESFNLTARDTALLRQYGLDPVQLTCCTVRTYRFGEALISEGVDSAFLFLITDGRAKVCHAVPNGKSLILNFYVSNGLIGEAEFFSGCTLGDSTVTALDRFRYIAIPIAPNRAALEQNLAFTRCAAHALGEKMQKVGRIAAENTLCSADVRLCRYIRDAAIDGRFRDVMQDVASSIGVSYRHLYRMLADLCTDGILQKTSSGYRILNAEALAARAQSQT